MKPVTVSSRHQILIPKGVRESMNIRPGMKLQVFAHNGVIELVPVRPVRELRGSCKGIDTHVERDNDRV